MFVLQTRKAAATTMVYTGPSACSLPSPESGQIRFPFLQPHDAEADEHTTTPGATNPLLWPMRLPWEERKEDLAAAG